MVWVIANTMSEYVSYVRAHKEIGRTRYIGNSLESYGINGKVLVLNDALRKFDDEAIENLKRYEHTGIIELQKVQF